MIYLSLAIPSACKKNTEAYPWLLVTDSNCNGDGWWWYDDDDDDADDDDVEKKGEKKRMGEWRRTISVFSLIVLKCF